MKKIIAMLLALAMVFTLVACGSKNTGDNEQPDDADNNVQDIVDSNQGNVAEDNTEVKDAAVVIDKVTQLDTAPTNLDPTAMNNSGMLFLWHVYEMPYQMSGFGGDLVPVLADATKGSYKEGMDHEAGSPEYTLYIREGIIDHAGNELKASDVKFSYDTMISSGNARGWAMFESCEVVDDYTVKLTFQRELNLAGELTTFFARVFFFTEAAYKASPSGFVSDACGTGPYKLESFTSGSTMTLVKNDDYWCAPEDMTNQIQQANVQTIEFVYAQETTSQIVALSTGDADFTQNLSLADVADFQDGGKYDDDYNVHVYWDNLTNCLLPNCHEDALTGDVNMRLAIFYAIDVDALASMQSGDVPGCFRACYGMGNPNFPDFSDSWAAWDNYQTTTDQAKVDEYLKAANYNGETVEIIAMAGDTETIATIVVGMLEAAGIKAHITLVDRSTQTVIKGKPTEWDISVESWASNDYIVNVWDKLYKTTNDEGYISESGQFIKDDELLELCLTAKTEVGHTQENVDAAQQHMIENAYCMGLTQKCGVLVYPTNVDALYMTDKNQVVVGATTYTAD